MKNTNAYTKTLFKAGLLLCTLCLAACRASSMPEPSATPIALPTATPEAQPVAGGELLLPIPRNPFVSEGGIGANPLLVNTEEMRNMYSLVYESLVSCDESNKIVPALAQKWSSDETGRVWTVVLRNNVFWHEGDEMLNAEDVIYTFSKLKSYGSSTYYFEASGDIEQIEQVDASTLRITMKTPGAAALYSLLFPVLSSSSSSASANGTGPYKVVSASETMVELSKNPRWWKQAPYIESIRCFSRESNAVALDSYEAGLLNMVPTSTVSAGKYREEGVTNVLDIMSQDAEVLLVNHNNASLRNADIRRAIAHAIDRSSIVSNVYMNRATICDVPVPPDSFLYDAGTKSFDYDPARAGSLLASAGLIDADGDGILEQGSRKLKLKLLVNESTENAYRNNAAALIAAQLLKVGIETEVVTAKLSIADEESDFVKKLSSGQFDLALAGFNLERSGNLAPYLTGSRNYGNIPVERWKPLLKSASSALDEKTMREAHSALQQEFIKELPFIMLYFRMNSLVYSADIHNVGDVRSTDVLRTIPRWYIKTAGS